MRDFPFSLVGFDLDGTLLDTHGDLAVALNHALASVGRPALAPEVTRGLIGGGTRKMLERGLAATGGLLDESELALLTERLVSHYEANIAHHTRLFPGGADMLDTLAARGVKLALVTNKLERLARRLLDELGLSPRFCTIIGGDSLGPGRAKPQPDLLLEMVARAGGEALRPAYVGDTTYDTRAARAAGMPCVAVRFGFCDLPPEELGADALIDHFNELLPTLEHLGVTRA